MLQCDRIDVSEGIDINQASESKEHMRCHYWYFKEVGYKFQLYVCNGCHAMSIIAYELKNVISIFIDYGCTLRGISKTDVIDSLNNSVLEDKDIL